MANLAIAVAGTTAAAAYLNAKYHVSSDLKLLKDIAIAKATYERKAKLKRAASFYNFEEAALKWPEHLSIWSREGCYTFGQTYEKACQYATFFLEKGVRPGETVAFYLRNSPDFLFAWLGLWAIGCAPAMINFNLSGEPLMHCLKVSGARYVLSDHDEALSKRLFDVARRLDQELGMEILHLNNDLKMLISSRSATRPADDMRDHIEGNFPAAVFYTSGTTGMPKGAVFSAARMQMAATLFKDLGNQKAGHGGDTWYICMPLYHGTGGYSAAAALMNGITIAIGKGFSVRNFWKDVHDSESTFFVYVGETARYLLAAPPSAWDKDHKIRCMFGNGLRPDVWTKFKQRFNIPEVIEFFNSSEGVFGLTIKSRGEFTANAVGHFGLIFRLLTRNIIFPVEVDQETNDVVRDTKTGFVKRRSWDEGGEIIVRLDQESDFPGYWNNKQSTKKQFIYDCEKKGDVFFRTGDALRRSPDGKWYFLDRLGDTFRWKSENVSTAEVAVVIGQHPHILEANVYGVQLPHHEGRAGCAALSIASSARNDFDWQAFARFAQQKLPRYAVPVFIRVLSGEVGDRAMHNNKQDKVALRTEGVEPNKLGTKVDGGEKDRILFLRPGTTHYEPFGEAEWRKLVAGSARL